MTAPVGTQEGAKIDRVSPDTVRQEGSRSWVVSFTMPAQWTLARLPQPDDSRVRRARFQCGGWLPSALGVGGARPTSPKIAYIFPRDAAGCRVESWRESTGDGPLQPTVDSVLLLCCNELLVELSEEPDAPATAERGPGVAR